jgi:protein SCO1/2
MTSTGRFNATLNPMPVFRPASDRRIWLILLAALSSGGCAKKYPLSGMVVRVNQPDRSVLVSHREIPGLMKPMVMSFPVRHKAELSTLYPGAQIEGQLVLRNRNSFLEDIRVREGIPNGVVEDQGDSIALPAPAGKVEIASLVPDFHLTDQNGEIVRLSNLRGSVVAVNFIYTRCPLPEVCPRLSANFASIQRRFNTRMGQDLTLLSVTLDPQHDTPDELRKYARIWNARVEGWRFLTGSSEQVREVAERFGMSYWPEEGLITHTTMTALISRDGRLSASIEGSSYRPRELGDLIEKELEKQP